jgi:TfoX/Sxy family transcriptional regulator of competence genes
MYDQHLADRIRMSLKDIGIAFSEKEMMGGLACMVNDKMCVGVIDDRMMARLDPEVYEEALTKKGCRPMDFTGRPMRGWVYIDPSGTDLDEDLNYWVQLALDFNPKAKSSKKRKK